MMLTKIDPHQPHTSQTKSRFAASGFVNLYSLCIERTETADFAPQHNLQWPRFYLA
ncbi:MAG: hypothetical protein H6658_04245 [Ardenticatenaceae bacterium]|nr:hypothetical protein [Ardenticatenaceae bacterium]